MLVRDRESFIYHMGGGAQQPSSMKDIIQFSSHLYRLNIQTFLSNYILEVEVNKERFYCLTAVMAFLQWVYLQLGWIFPKT